MKDNMSLRDGMVWAAGVIGVALIISAIVGAVSFYNVRAMDNVLSVTGSAKKSIVADRAQWSVSISRPSTIDTLQGGYSQMARDLNIVKAFFAKNGFAEASLKISPVLMEEVYENYASGPKKYTLRQTVELKSDDVVKIDALSKNTQEVISQGVVLSTQSPQYSYSGLAELRVSLLSDALKDAEARAESIAQVTGDHAGKLKSAASGVVQVLPEGSTEVSDYGAYDMSSINKEVMVTVRASFAVR